MKTTVSDFLNLMNKNDPAVIGNKIPDENFYYIDGKQNIKRSNYHNRMIATPFFI